jgi:hypothetical protein
VGTTFAGPFGPPFAGTIDFKVGGEHQQVSTEVVPIVNEGVIEGTMHTFEFEQGTITTHDVLLAPLELKPGEQQLWVELNLTHGGTGKMRVLPTGTINIFGGMATWEMRGRICFD